MSDAEGWITKRFDEIGKIFSGSTPSTTVRAFWNGNIVWVTPNDLSKLNAPYLRDSAKRITEKGLSGCSANLLPAGSIVMSSRAPIGYVAIPKVEFCTNQGCKSIQLKDGFTSEFTYYNILFNINKVKNLGEGTTFAEISKTALSTVELDFPSSKPEQTKIAEILSTVDRAIEQTEALIAKQQRIKTGLMQDLLTRGIDEHGNLRSEKTHKFKDSPLGRIPVEWEVVSLSHYVSFIRSGLSRRIIEDDIGIPVITSSNIQQSLLDSTKLSYWYLKDPQGAKTEAYFLDDKDILLNFINSVDQIGKVCLFHDLGRPTIYTTNLFRIKARQATDQVFLFHLLDSHIVQNEIKLITKPAVNQASFTTGDFLGISVPLVPYDEQLRIVEFLFVLNNHNNGAILALSKLNRKKTALMQDLLTGKKRVTVMLNDTDAVRG